MATRPSAAAVVNRAIAQHGEQVLHQEHWPHDREGNARLLKRPLRLSVLARDLERGSLIGAEHRKLDDLTNAAARGRLDDTPLPLWLPAALRRNEE
jgi:hypothetical protein